MPPKPAAVRNPRVPAAVTGPSVLVRVLTALGLVAATVAAFAGVRGNGWIQLDDPLYVVDNPHVNRGWTWDGFRWFLTHSHGSNWHPLTSWTHMLDVQLFGLTPVGPHLVNVALHTLTALLVLFTLHRLTGAWWRASLVALLFAVHPLRVESVAWVSERKDVLSGVFFVLTLLAWGEWARRPSPARYAAALGVFALGLMAKPMLVTVPAVLLLLDAWPLGRWREGVAARAGAGAAWRARLIEKWPFALLAAISAVLTVVMQRGTGAVVPFAVIPLSARFANAAVSVWRYARDLVWPRHLTIFYPFDTQLSALVVIASVVALAGAAWALARWRGRVPALAMGWAWSLVMLLPVIGLLQVGGQSHADRYTYLPQLGLLIGIVWTVADALAARPAAARAAFAAALVAAAALGLATRTQVARWHDSTTLFRWTLAVTRDNAIAHQCLGDVAMQAGHVAEALPHYRESVRIWPTFWDSHNKLGAALGATGHWDQAVVELERAAVLSQDPGVQHNLGFAYLMLGRVDDALPHFDAALRADPDDVRSLTHRGLALRAKQRFAEAEEDLRHAARLTPADADVHRELAVTCIVAGDVAEGLQQYGEILARDPDDLDALNNVAWIRATHARAEVRDGREAVRMAERARDKSPVPVAILYSTLAAAYAEAGRMPDAVAAGERAVALAKQDGDSVAIRHDEEQLARYRAGQPFHFAR